MRKKDIIKLLNEEVGMFERTEDEDSLGKLVLTELEFKTAEQLLHELKEKRDKIREWEKELRRIVTEDGRFEVLTDSVLQEKVVKCNHPLIAIDSSIISCVFKNNTEV